jgi:hypothetical protein
MSAPVFINITPYTIEYNGETTLHPIITSEAHDYQEEVFYIFIKQNPLAITPEGTIVTINRKRRIFDLKYNTKMYDKNPPTEPLVDLISYNYTPVSVMSTNKKYLEDLAEIENRSAGRKSNRRKSNGRKSNRRKSNRRKSIRRKSIRRKSK